MKSLLLLIILFFLSFNNYAQKNESYYQKIIDTTKNKKLKLASLDSLIHDIRNQKDLKIFANRTEQFVDLAIELKEYESAIKYATRAFYYINTRLGENKRALKLIEKVEEIKDKTTKSRLLGSIYLKKAGAYSTATDHAKAIENFTKAINYFSSKDSIYIADALYFRGVERFESGRFLEATNDYQLSSIYYEKLGDKQYMFYALGSINSVYAEIGFYEKSIDEMNKLIQKKNDNNFSDYLFTDYYNQSLNYKKLDSINRQEEYLQKSYKAIEKSKVPNLDNSKLKIKSDLSKFYALKNDLANAEKHLQEAEILSKKVDKKSNSFSAFLRAKAQYAFQLKEYKNALNFAKKSHFYSTQEGNVITMMESSRLLSDIYNSLGNKNSSLNYFKNYTAIKDSIYSVTKTNALSFYQTLYRTERKEKEINKQKASIDILARENEEKNRLIIFGGISLLLLFFIFYLYRNRKQSERKRAMQEEYSQKMLLSQEEERKRISKDLHDSLGQSLLLIKNKVSLKDDEKTKELVNNAIEEMRSISRILHPFQLEEIGISRALENLISQLDENYTETLIFGDIDDIKGILNTNQEVNVFRIVQECFSNIIKHAKADSAKVTLINKGEDIIIAIKDNGIGFDFSEKYNDFKSLGLKTIKERVKFLKGTLKIDSIKGEGTTFTIQFSK
jgi:signal transduction histidine kinase